MPSAACGGRGINPLVGGVKRVQGVCRALYGAFFGHRPLTAVLPQTATDE